MIEKESIAILMTCFNRKELTRKCLKSLMNSEKRQNRYEFNYYIVDDGCTDGTSQMLDSEFCEVIHLKGNGNLFWNGGMHYAFQEAVKNQHDFYIWVNDDVQFYQDAIINLMKLYQKMGMSKVIISGYTVGEDEKTVTYGGQRLKRGIIPLNLLSVASCGKKIEKCDSMHGNCVLIPHAVVDSIGIIDPYYTHGFGDIDYGLRATAHGIPVYISDFPVGICKANPRDNRKNSFKHKKLIERFKLMNSVYYRPVKDWHHFTKKHGGILWFLRFIAPYIKLTFNKYE